VLIFSSKHDTYMLVSLSPVKLLFHECCTKRCTVPGWTKERISVRTPCSLGCGRFFSAYLTTVRLRPLTSRSPVIVANVHRSYLTYLLHQHGSSSSPGCVLLFADRANQFPFSQHVRYCIKYTTRSTKALGFMDVILLHSGHQHVSDTHVAIFRVVGTRIQI